MIAESSLGLGAIIGSGGFADTHLVNAPVGSGLPADVVYKRWRAGATSQDAVHVTQLIEFRKRLSIADRSFLDSIAAWPLELVGSGGIASGFLMPCAPKVFMYHDNARGLTTAAIGLLYAKAQRGRKAGAFVPFDGDLVSRLTITAQLAYALSWLHDRGAVFGDISHVNELFTIKGHPRIYLIDTDGISIPSSRIPQANTPNYIPPESSKSGAGASRATDVYKFTLAMVRILAHPRAQLSQTASPDFLVGILDQEGLDLVTRGLAARPQDRPTLAELYGYLYRFVGVQLSPPRITSVRIDPEYAIQGDAVHVSIDVDGAEGVAVLSPDGIVARGLRGSHLVVPFRALTGGVVVVGAMNAHGLVKASSAPLHILPPVVTRPATRAIPARPDWLGPTSGLALGLREPPSGMEVPGISADEIGRQTWRFVESRRSPADPRHYPVRAPERALHP